MSSTRSSAADGRRSGPICNAVNVTTGERCRRRGWHLCEPRANRAVRVFHDILVHTKGRFARQPFLLEDWQEHEIIRPLFGEVRWSPDAGAYVRRYRVAWIELARKNGKSELLAGIALILLVADDEQGAEIYGCAKDRDQARKVFDVAERMVELSPMLRRRLRVFKQTKRIVDERTGSYYEIVAADAAGNLGHNPHGIVFDEVLTQPNDGLWNAMRTAMGARLQPLMIAATTAGDDLSGFCKIEHDYCERIAAAPELDPARFVFMRNLPMDADPWNEDNWRIPNPALGSFLSIDALRDEAREARANPVKENAFRQFRLNQWVSQVTRWMPLHLYDAAAGGELADAELVGQRAWGGLDLSSVSDLTSLCWWFPNGDDVEAGGRLIWRHFAPEAVLSRLDEYTAGQASVWARSGHLHITEGDVVDYDAVHERIAADAAMWPVQVIGIDRWNSTATTNWLSKTLPKVQVELVGQGFAGMTNPLKTIMRLVKLGTFHHAGNPVARWCFDSVEVRQDDAENIKPVKPDRQRARARIDAVVSAAMALDGWLRNPAPRRSGRAVGF